MLFLHQKSLMVVIFILNISTEEYPNLVCIKNFLLKNVVQSKTTIRKWSLSHLGFKEQQKLNRNERKRIN